MSNKIIAVVAYLTIIGWVIAFFLHKNNPSYLSNVHLKNGLGLHSISFLLNIGMVIFGSTGLYTIFPFINLGIFVLTVFGVVYAATDRPKAIPLIGDWLQKKIPNL